MRRLSVLLALTVLLSGCARAGRDTAGLLPVLTAGLSATPDGTLTLTAEAVRQDELEGAASAVYLTTQGKTPQEVLDQADARMADALYLSHARTLVIDERLARSGLHPLVRALLARGDVRLTLRLAVARGVPAQAVVQGQALAGQIAGEALGDLLDRRAHTGLLPDLPLCRTADALLAGRDFALPALTCDAQGCVVAAGQAEFRLGRLTGFSGGVADA